MRGRPVYQMQRNDIRLDGTSVINREESRQVERIGFQLSPPLLFLVGLALGGVGRRVGL